MPLRKLARHAKEVWEVPRDLLLRRYPPFVTGAALPQGHVPVFVFHGVEPEMFSRKLSHLAESGYVSLAADEYLGVLSGARKAPERAVVLTFDDGRASLWQVGLPLMQRFGMRGIVFLVPGRIASRPGALSPIWSAGQALPDRDGSDEPFLSWEEIEAMQRSGVFEFHSHTLRHARIHSAPQVASFMGPAQRRGYAMMDVPLVEEGGRDLLAPSVPLGTPLLRSEPRTSESLRFFEATHVRTACVETVAAGGGEGFFYRRDWERTLHRVAARQRIQGRYETPDERAAAIRLELAEAKALIEERTGRPAVHLCYPWHAAGPTARRLAREAGYVSAFCGKVAGVPITLPGGDPLAIARIGEDYVELLPGKNRSDLATVLRQKWSRRIRAGR
jgi:peptidoglycan/xylan/chitin deacetylase (PgdA/CDA1 family)